MRRPATTAHLRIVGINDVYVLRLLPKLATLVHELRTEQPADTLLITVAGDFLAPSLLSSLDAGRGMVDCLDALGVTHVTLGNHEDDLATSDLVERLAELDAQVLLTNVEGFAGRSTPSDTVPVGSRTVGLVGVIDGDPALYHRDPFGGATVHPTQPAVAAQAQRLREAGCAAVVALTHQPLPADRLLADAGIVDLVLGGHEHDGHTERDHAAPLVKAPMNARCAVVADLFVQPDGRVRSDVRLQPVAGYAPDPAMQARVDGHLAAVKALEAQVLLELEPGHTLSSRGAREGQTTLGTLVASRLRDTLQAHLAVFNGGALRGGADYEGRLSFADLRRELPFAMESVVVELPGEVLQETFRFAVDERKGTGGYLQHDDGVVVDAQGGLVEVAGHPFDPDSTYRVALPRTLLDGIDDLEPLVRWAEAHAGQLPPVTTGIDAKVALVRSLSVGSAGTRA